MECKSQTIYTHKTGLVFRTGTGTGVPVPFMCGPGTQTVLLFLVFPVLCGDAKLVQTIDEKKKRMKKKMNPHL
jgi:hypothetical protein